jgi:hypothetical protein
MTGIAADEKYTNDFFLAMQWTARNLPLVAGR